MDYSKGLGGAFDVEAGEPRKPLLHVDHLDELNRKLEASRSSYVGEIFWTMVAIIQMKWIKAWDIPSFNPSLALFTLERERGKIARGMLIAIDKAHAARTKCAELQGYFDAYHAIMQKTKAQYEAQYEEDSLRLGRTAPFTPDIFKDMLTKEEEAIFTQLQFWKIEIASERRKYTQATNIITDVKRRYEQNTFSMEQLDNASLVDKVVTELDEARRLDTTQLTDRVIGRMNDYNDAMRDMQLNAEASNRQYVQALETANESRNVMRENHDEFTRDSSQVLQTSANTAWDDDIMSGLFQTPRPARVAVPVAKAVPEAKPVTPSRPAGKTRVAEKW